MFWKRILLTLGLFLIFFIVLNPVSPGPGALVNHALFFGTGSWLALGVLAALELVLAYFMAYLMTMHEPRKRSEK